MGRCHGRARAHAVLALLMFGALGSQPALVIAQDEEVISDPELSGGGGARGSSSGDEVIEDPELSGSGARKPASTKKDYGWGEVYQDGQEEREQETQAAEPVEPPEEPDPMANTGIAKLEVSGQTAIDTAAEGDMEDFYEARLRFGGEVEFRISRRLRLSIGTRIDYGWYAPFQNDPSLTTELVNFETGRPLLDVNNKQRVIRRTMLQEDRHEVDIVPLAAYVDATVADGVHLRIGAQVISLARMDGLSVTDMLSVVDFRPTTKMDPAGIKLAQPAVRLDWDFNSWATLQLIYVPWFMPHLTRPNRDNYVGRAFGMVGSSSLPSTGLSDLIEPSYQTRAQEDVLRFVGPAPDFTTPQAEARLNFRGSSFELALLGGTAIEKLPAVYYTPLVNSLLTASLQTPENRRAFIQQGGRAAELLAAEHVLVDAEYHRYYLAGVDGSFDIAPVQINFEFAYSPSRHMYTSDENGRALPMPDVSKPLADGDETGWVDLPGTPDVDRCISPTMACANDRSVRKGVQLVQAALHIEYLWNDQLALVAEGYLSQALALPHGRSRQWLFFPKDKGTFLAGVLMGSYAAQEGKYNFALSAMFTSGPSFIITPQIEFRLTEGFYLNIGAQFFEGPSPNNLKPGSTRRVATNLTPGGALSGYDNVYLGFRWNP